MNQSSSDPNPSNPEIYPALASVEPLNSSATPIPPLAVSRKSFPLQGAFPATRELIPGIFYLS